MGVLFVSNRIQITENTTTSSNIMPTKTKQQQSKKKKAPRRSGTVSFPVRGTARLPEAAIHAVCGLTDPFCDHAISAKYPDDASTRTLPWMYRGLSTMNGSSAGDACRLYVPQLAYRPFVNYSTGALPVVTSFADAPSNNQVPDSATQYRIVSWGLRLRNITAPLSSSGIVHVRFWGMEEGGPFVGDTNVAAYNNTGALDIALQDCHDLCIIGKHSSQMPQTMYNVDGDSSVIQYWTAKGFTGITVYLDGVPADTPVLSIEHIIHYELVFSNVSGMSSLATPSPPFNPIITTAAAHVTSTMENAFASGLRSVGNYVVSRAKTALLRALMPTPIRAAAMLTVD